MVFSQGRHARKVDRAGGVAGNTRLTSSVAVILLVTLFLEGLTIVQVGAHLTWHVFLGIVLIPISLLKAGATTWRFVRYYLKNPDYQRKGPPPLLLRLLGPFVVILTMVLLFTGLGLIVIAPVPWRSTLLGLHRISFVLWFGAMTIHVLGHLGETASQGWRDYVRRTRRDVAGASLRQWSALASLATGVVLGIWLTPYANNFFGSFGGAFGQ